MYDLLLYVSRLVETTTTTVPVTEMQYSPLSVSYQVLGWFDDVSVVFKQQNETFDLQDEMEVWVNGQLTFTQTFFNYYCPTYNTYYHFNPYDLPIPLLGVKDNVTISLSYPGGTITKTGGLNYLNNIDSLTDPSHPETGFEVIESYAITNTKVTDSTVQSWLNNSSQYPAGYKKAIYGTFMTALTTLWLNKLE